MYLQVLTIIAPVFILAGVGYIWARLNYDFPSEFIARIVMNIGAPCLFVSAMAEADIDLGALFEVVVAALSILFAMLVFGTVLVKRLGLKTQVYLPPLLFPNNGNMGLSLCMFTFGDTGLALGLGIFMTMTVCQFTLGILLTDESVTGSRSRLLELTKQPIVYAAIFSVLCLAGGYHLPKWAANTVSLMGGITIPLMLVTLGVSLARLSISNFSRAVLFSSIRLGGGFLLGLGVAYLYDLEGIMRGVVIVQASMPVAVFNYLLAVRYQQSPTETAGIVIVSTILSFLTLPFLLSYVMT